MKLIHCADLHLDSSMDAHMSREQAKMRRDELLKTFLRMVDFAAEENVQAILIAGDLFDKRKISVTARNTVLSAIQSHPDITFFYVTGNHERDGFLSSLTEIPGNLKLFGETWRTYDAGVISITGADLEASNKQQLMDSLVLDPARFHIVLLHGQIAEFTSDRHAEVFDIRAFQYKNIDYLALGHIHSYRTDALPSRGIWCYPGCLEGRGFDEVGEHGFVLLDVDPETRTCTHRFVPFAERMIREMDVDVSGCLSTSEMMQRVENALAEEIPSGEVSRDIWKILLTGEVDVSCEKNISLIHSRFSDRCFFLRIKDKTHLAVNYHDYAMDASLKGEFVRLVEQDASLEDQEKAEIIRCGIQALNKEEIVI